MCPAKGYVSLHLDGTLRTKIGLENILQTNCGCDVHLKSLSSSGNLGIRVDRLECGGPEQQMKVIFNIKDPTAKGMYASIVVS